MIPHEISKKLTASIKFVMPQVIAWRRDIHAHPELGFQEHRTAQLVTDHLRQLNIDIQTGIAQTGVVGTLHGDRPGTVVGLRADMDALPIREETGLPFASTEETTFHGRTVHVMHACGHDAHTAILMGVATALYNIRDQLPGVVKFIFQPAEEGMGGAEQMIRSGILSGNTAPTAIFGLHVGPSEPGTLGYRYGGLMAAGDRIIIRIRGKQTHGASPWLGVDSVTLAAQIITALQMIPARQLDVNTAPAVISMCRIQAGSTFNILPEIVELEGTLRTFDPTMRTDALVRMKRTIASIADSAGASAEMDVQPIAPVTYNDPELMSQMLPALHWAAGTDHVVEIPRMMMSEDFGYYQEKIPGLFLFLGVNKPNIPEAEAYPNHSPRFYVNEDALIIGVRALAGLAVDYLYQHTEKGER